MRPPHWPPVIHSASNQHPLSVDTFQLSTRAPTIQSRQDTNEARNSSTSQLLLQCSPPHFGASQHGPPATMTTLGEIRNSSSRGSIIMLSSPANQPADFFFSGAHKSSWKWATFTLQVPTADYGCAPLLWSFSAFSPEEKVSLPGFCSICGKMSGVARWKWKLILVYGQS